MRKDLFPTAESSPPAERPDWRVWRPALVFPLLFGAVVAVALAAEQYAHRLHMGVTREWCWLGSRPGR